MLRLFKAVLSGKASFNQIAANLKRTEMKSMSRRAMHDRIDEIAVSFMISVTGQALKERWAQQGPICSKLFNRVLIEDSSQAKTHRNNSEDFPGHGNGTGETAGCKSDLAYCLHVALQGKLRHLAGGLTPRAVLEKFGTVQMLDVHLPVGDKRELVMPRYTQPDKDLRILLTTMGLELPQQPPPKIRHRSAPEA